jgi:sporulation protein YlmC with PRC-barrel domain
MVEITRIFWKPVVTSDAFVLGEIESAELDTNTWQLKSLYVSLNDAATQTLGFERPFLGKVMVCLPVSTVKAIKDTAVLNKTIRELRELKECKK